MWTSLLPWRVIKTLSASPSADCQGRSRERHPWACRRAQGVLPQPSCAGIARTHSRARRFIPSKPRPAVYTRRPQTLRILPLHTRQKGQGPKLKPADNVQDMTSTRADSCTGPPNFHPKVRDGMPPVFHWKVRDGMQADFQIGILC